MKRLFKAVRQNDIETVKRILGAKPELINCVATPPPKKDNGQSLLQVANKVNNYEIAHYLIDKGIDVNYSNNKTFLYEKQSELRGKYLRKVSDSK
jgi:hypothetical protein